MALIPYADIDKLPEKAREAYDRLPRKLNIFRMWANAPDCFVSGLRFGGNILSRQKLGADLRELVILLVARLEGGTYEWVQHVPIAEAAGCKKERFVKMYVSGDKKLHYQGSDLVGDLIAVYDGQAALCTVGYTRSDGSQISIPYEEARKRLFAMSFDPYQCIEHRWGAGEPMELSTCLDDANKRAWYGAEQNLRNQIDRTYDAQMDFDLDELQTPGPGKGVATAPDTDVRAYLLSVRGAMAGSTLFPTSLQ